VFQPAPVASGAATGGSGTGGPGGGALPDRRTRRYVWRPFPIEVGPWNPEESAGCWSAEVERSRPSDLFTLTSPPRVGLPIAHLETAIAVAPGDSGTWRLGSLDLHEPRGVPVRVLIGACGAVRIVDSDGRPLVSIGGSMWSEGEETR
jgi:hypothetical protein